MNKNEERGYSKCEEIKIHKFNFTKIIWVFLIKIQNELFSKIKKN